MRTFKKTFISFFIFFFVFSPIRFDTTAVHFIMSDLLAGTPDDYGIIGDAILIEEDRRLTKNDTSFFNKRVFIVNGATLTIEPGVHLTLGNDAGSEEPGYLAVLDGALRATGTEEDPVIFSGDSGKGFSLEFFNENPANEASFLRYATFFRGGGTFVDNGGSVGYFRPTLFQTTFAAENGWGALKYYAGKVHIENSVFSENRYADIEIENPLFDVDSTTNYFEVVNSNFENNENETALSINEAYCSADVCEKRVLLKNNWYGSPDGPRVVSVQNPDGGSGGGALISDQVVLDGYRENNLIADPLLIVPGITGSAKVLGTWKLDPITHIYADLMTSLDVNGYEENINLFPFPYEWRNTNKTSALYLQAKIEGVRQGTRVSKVDVVGHSMGGLVARAYIEEIEGTQYEDTIDQLITLGTPHRGSPEAYLQWEAGEGFFDIKDLLAKHHFEQEAEEAGYNDRLKDYINERVISVRELLPDQDYLFDVAAGQMRNYPNRYPQNSFLGELNSITNTQKLNPIRFTNIVGKSDTDNTISQIRVVESTVEDQWEHGMPENFYDNRTDQGLEYGVGDETVPLASAQDVTSNRIAEIESTHNDLPTKAQCLVFQELTGKSQCAYDEDVHIPNMLLFDVFSPIDIQIISPSGKKVGKNFATGGIYDQIPGAYYTGYDTQNEFITVPNPEDGEYTILTQGTGDGDYRVEAVKITEETTPSDDVKESLVTFTGTATPDVMEEKKIELLADDTVIPKEERDIAAPAVTIISPENKSYPSSEQVPVTYTAADDVSPEEKITKEIRLDGAVFDQMIIDLSLQTLGTHTLSVQATDEAGNTATETVTFQNTASFASLNKNILHYSTLGLIKKKEDARHIQASLKYLEQLTKLIVRIERMQYFPAQGKERLIKNFKREIEKRKGELFKYMEKRVRKGIIDTEARDRIVEGVEMLVQ